MRGIKFEKNLDEISVISARSRLSRLDLGEISATIQISPRSRQFYRDLAEIAGLSLHFLCSLMGVQMYIYRADYTPLFFSCPSTQSVDMEKTETGV